jgi:hypothetical protein
VPELDGRGDDAAVGGLAVEAGHERPVDLERDDRQAGDVGERRVAGAEVVDAQPDAERAEPFQHRQPALRVVPASSRAQTTPPPRSRWR